MRTIFACFFYFLSLLGQGAQTLLIYYTVTGYYLPTKLAVLLFVPTFILTYWFTLAFDALSTTKKSSVVTGSSGTVIRVKNTVFPKKVKKILRTVSMLWTIAIVIVWTYFFIKFSLWYLI